MRLAARSISSAPVTTRRTARIVSHFAASASSRKSARPSGKVSKCTDGGPCGRYMNQASSAVKLMMGASHLKIASQRISTVVSAALRVVDDGGSQYRTSLRMSKQNADKSVFMKCVSEATPVL